MGAEGAELRQQCGAGYAVLWFPSGTAGWQILENYTSTHGLPFGQFMQIGNDEFAPRSQRELYGQCEVLWLAPRVWGAETRKQA